MHRDRLWLHYRDIPRLVAARLVAGLPANVERDDLESFGQDGLLDAMAKFDPERGRPFETYAIPRVTGSIIDKMREVDWIRKGERYRRRTAALMAEHLTHALRRHPTDAEVAAALGVPSLPSELMLVSLDAEFRRPWMGHAALRSAGMNDEPSSWADRLGGADDPAAVYEAHGDLAHQLAVAIAGLDDRQRAVMALHYLLHKTLEEIGEILASSKTRASQLLTEAQEALRARLAGTALDAFLKERA